jgi:DNA invertase Pin-like site-specific DNA recombinase
MNNSAISYLRFSSTKQKKGASYDRQIEATEKFCAENNLKLIDQIEDQGISGWNEENLEETAALGKLIKLIESGQIKKGTTLIVENLDRITRANVNTAIHLVTGILEKGIEIVTTMDGKRYRKNCNPTDLMIAIIYLTRGNDESETKSKRVKQSWQRKRQLINDGKFVKLTQHPNWLKVENNKYVENEEATKLVKRIFEMYTSGIGSHLISKQLNKEGLPPFSRTGKRFTFSSIERLLKNSAVIGKCEVVSPPKENYYPRIISDGVWYQAQSMREKNNHYKGTRNDSDKVNFLAGIIFCQTCSNSMVRYSCGKQNKRYHYLVCSAAKYGEHKMVLFDYKTVQEVFLTAIHKANFLNSFLVSKKNNIDSGKIEELTGKLLEIKTKIGNVCDAIEDTNNSELKQRLNRLQSEQVSIETEIETQKKLISDIEYNLSTKNLFFKTVLKDIDDNRFRIRVRNFLRVIIHRAWVWRDKELDGVIIHVRFKESNDKLTLITKDKGDWQTLIQLNDEILGFSNSKGAGWYDEKCNPQGIDPFYFKNETQKGGEISIENFLLQPPESKD